MLLKCIDNGEYFQMHQFFCVYYLTYIHKSFAKKIVYEIMFPLIIFIIKGRNPRFARDD